MSFILCRIGDPIFILDRMPPGAPAFDFDRAVSLGDPLQKMSPALAHLRSKPGQRCPRACPWQKRPGRDFFRFHGSHPRWVPSSAGPLLRGPIRKLNSQSAAKSLASPVRCPAEFSGTALPRLLFWAASCRCFANSPSMRLSSENSRPFCSSGRIRPDRDGRGCLWMPSKWPTAAIPVRRANRRRKRVVWWPEPGTRVLDRLVAWAGSTGSARIEKKRREPRKFLL